MTEAAASTERVRPDQRLPITPARVAVLQEACAVAAAIHTALDLGAVACVTEKLADPAAVAADCGLTQQGAQARAAVRRAGLEDQYEFVAGSAFDVDWGEPASYDLALVANLCHLFDGEAKRLVRRVADALRPGGRIAIVDILPTERGDRSPAVLYALGLEDTRRHNLPGPYPFTLIASRRQ